MRIDVLAELKSLRLHGMAQAWSELEAQGEGMGLQTSRWLLEHLLRAEQVERHMRSVAHQLKSARFPLHRDLAGFDFEGSAVDETLVGQATGRPVVHGSGAQRGPHRRARHGQDAPGHCTGRRWHHSAGPSGAVLLDGGPGQCAGTGEGTRQGRPSRGVAGEHGPGDPG